MKEAKIVMYLNADVNWFVCDWFCVTENLEMSIVVVLDFEFDERSIVEYTINGGNDYVSLNNGSALTGKQTRFITLQNGDRFNVRAKYPIGLLENRLLISK